MSCTKSKRRLRESKTSMAKAATRQNGERNFEATLWAAADKLRGTLDAAEYKHVVLGLIFLKYISDSFEPFARQVTSLLMRSLEVFR